MAFFDAGGVVLALWHWALLAEDEEFRASPAAGLSRPVASLATSKRPTRSTPGWRVR